MSFADGEPAMNGEDEARNDDDEGAENGEDETEAALKNEEERKSLPYIELFGLHDINQESQTTKSKLLWNN